MLTHQILEISDDPTWISHGTLVLKDRGTMIGWRAVPELSTPEPRFSSSFPANVRYGSDHYPIPGTSVSRSPEPLKIPCEAQRKSSSLFKHFMR